MSMDPKSQRTGITTGLVVLLFASTALGAAPDQAYDSAVGIAEPTPVELDAAAAPGRPQLASGAVAAAAASGQILGGSGNARHVIYVEPVRLFSADINATWETVVFPHIGLLIGANYQLGLEEDSEARGLRLRAGANLHFNGNGVAGWYLGGRVYGDHSNKFEAEALLDDWTLSAGGVLGYRAVFGPGISVGASVGAAYSRDPDFESSDLFGTEGLTPVAEFHVGFAF